MRQAEPNATWIAQNAERTGFQSPGNFPGPILCSIGGIDSGGFSEDSTEGDVVPIGKLGGASACRTLIIGSLVVLISYRT